MLARNFILSEIRKALLEADVATATTQPTPPPAAAPPPAATSTGGTDLEKNKKLRQQADQALKSIMAELSVLNNKAEDDLNNREKTKKLDLQKAEKAIQEILKIIDIQGRIIEKQKIVDKKLNPESNLMPEVRAILNDLREKVKSKPELKDEIAKMPANDTPAIRDLMTKTGYNFSDSEKWAQFSTAVTFLRDSYRAESGGQIAAKEPPASSAGVAAAALGVINDLEKAMNDTIKKYPEVFGTKDKPTKPKLNLPTTGRGIPEKYCPICRTVQDAIKQNKDQIIDFIKQNAIEVDPNRLANLIDILFKGKKGKKGRLVDGYLGPTTLAFMVYASKGKLNPADYPVLGVSDEEVKESLQKVCEDFRIVNGKQMNQEALNTILQAISAPSSFFAALQDMGKLPKEEIVAESKNIRSLIIKEIYEMMKQG